VVLGVHRPIRRDELADLIGAGKQAHVDYNGRQWLVTDRLLILGLVKQRAGVGTGRYPVCLDPVELELHALSDLEVPW
jgi:hypothetical protein